MNKEQIEEAEKYFIEQGHAEQIFGIRVFYDKDVIELMAKYLESKCEEIERKAWIAGFIEKASRFYISDMEDEEIGNIFYDQWKESQKKEQ